MIWREFNEKSLIVMLCVIMIIAIIGCGEVNTEDMDVAANTQNNTAEKEEKIIYQEIFRSGCCLFRN